jgi:hypothetical protein
MNNIFDWLKEINSTKSHPDSFTEQDWDVWNSYMVHRFLSMNVDFLPLVNEVQKITPTNKKEIYSIYREYIPKNNKWSKYIKSKVKQRNSELIDYLVGYFNVSRREVKEYLDLLGSKEVTKILSQLGVEGKEIKKLLK